MTRAQTGTPPRTQARRMTRARTLSALLVLGLTLAACGGFRDSRVNPRNWFSGSSSEPTLGPTGNTTDNRPLVPVVSTLVIEPTSTGAIVRAEAVMPTVGWWDAELVAVNNARPVDGVVTYRFVAARPRQPVTVSAQGPRTLTAAATLSVIQLETIREVAVVGAENTRRARR
jgi:hypothetical protein